jgi:twitching motility protein PilT
MQTGQEKHGMQTFNQSLSQLVLTKQIALEDALAKSSNAEELQDLVQRGVGLNFQSAAQRMQRLEHAGGLRR